VTLTANIGIGNALTANMGNGLPLPTTFTSEFIVDTILGELNWTDKSGGLAIYEIYRSINGETTTLLTTTAAGVETYNDTTCKQNAIIIYSIRAKIGSNYSGFSSSTLITPLCFKTDQSTLTQVLINRIDIAGGSTVNIDWGDGTNADYTGSNINVTKDYASLVDVGKGTFDVDTESWAALGNNTIARVIEDAVFALEITYVDNSGGAIVYLRDAADLTRNLTIGKSYILRFRGKINIAGSTRLRVHNNAIGTTYSELLTTSFAWDEIEFTAQSDTEVYLDCASLGVGQIVYIDEWTLLEDYYNIKISGDTDDITYFSHTLQAETYGDVTNWILPSAITSLDMAGTSQTGDVTDWELPSTLITLYLYTTAIAGNITDWELPANMNRFDIVSSGLTGIVTDWVLPATLQYLYINSTLLTGDVTDWVVPTAAKFFYLNNSSLIGDISDWILPETLTNFRANNTGLTGKTPNITAHATNALIYYLQAASLSGTNTTVFREAMTVFNISSQNVAFSIAEINELLLAIADWYEVNAPTANCAYTMNGANMGIPTGGNANVDKVRIEGYYTAEGKTATITVNT